MKPPFCINALVKGLNPFLLNLPALLQHVGFSCQSMKKKTLNSNRRYETQEVSLCLEASSSCLLPAVQLTSLISHYFVLTYCSKSVFRSFFEPDAYSIKNRSSLLTLALFLRLTVVAVSLLSSSE